MAKSENTQHKVTFHNIKVSDIIIMDCRDDIPQNTLDIVKEFMELSEDGCKVSFGAKPSKGGYSVAVTLPVVGIEGGGSCASFWSGEAYEAWEKAYIATYVFNAGNAGWDAAEERMKRHEAEIVSEIAKARALRKQK